MELVALVPYSLVKYSITQGRAGGGGKRRGLGPRNDVLTTCKAVTQRGGQQIITVFFPQEIFLDFLEARSEPAEEIRNA